MSTIILTEHLIIFNIVTGMKIRVFESVLTKETSCWIIVDVTGRCGQMIRNISMKTMKSFYHSSSSEKKEAEVPGGHSYMCLYQRAVKPTNMHDCISSSRHRLIR